MTESVGPVFIPNVILRVPHIATFETNGAEEEIEQVGVLAAPAFTGVHEGVYIAAVDRKAVRE